MQVCDNIQQHPKMYQTKCGVHKSGDLVWGQPSENPGQPKIVPSPVSMFVVNPHNHRPRFIFGGKKILDFINFVDQCFTQFG